MPSPRSGFDPILRPRALTLVDQLTIGLVIRKSDIKDLCREAHMSPSDTGRREYHQLVTQTALPELSGKTWHRDPATLSGFSKP